MAYKNKRIHNRITGQEIHFLKTAKDTDGAVLEMEATFSPHSAPPPAHFHPHQTEDFKILAGTLNVELDGKSLVLHQGDTLHIPANKVHAMWNPSNEQTIVHWRVQPALQSEYFFETITGLANDGKTNGKGVPGLLQLTLLVPHFAGELRLTSPPALLQRLLFGLLRPIANLCGYRPLYKQYID